jgi:hypothetical protein
MRRSRPGARPAAVRRSLPRLLRLRGDMAPRLGGRGVIPARAGTRAATASSSQRGVAGGRRRLLPVVGARLLAWLLPVRSRRPLLAIWLRGRQ